MKRGCIYSECDRIGEYPRTAPHTPGDMAATIFHALGLNPENHIHDRLGRPFPLADGEPMEGDFV